MRQQNTIIFLEIVLSFIMILPAQEN